MAWTTPKTWAVGDPLTADVLNEQVRDNLAALKTPAFASFFSNTTYTPPNSWNAVDDDFVFNITTIGGGLLLAFRARCTNQDVNYERYLDIDVKVDGVRVSSVYNQSKITQAYPDAAQWEVGEFMTFYPPIAAGAHTVELVTSGNHAFTLSDQPYFWVKEIL